MQEADGKLCMFVCEEDPFLMDAPLHNLNWKQKIKIGTTYNQEERDTWEPLKKW